MTRMTTLLFYWQKYDNSKLNIHSLGVDNIVKVIINYIAYTTV
jgi:hypothetical protein